MNVGSVAVGQRSASWTGAVMALTREWAAELLPYGIRVNMVLAGGEGHRKIDEPPGKIVENIAAVVTFLLSTKSSHTTGQHIYADCSYGLLSSV